MAEIKNSQEIKNESSDDFIRNIKYIQYSWLFHRFYLTLFEMKIK
jgi:hypothetical protein